MSAKIDEAEDDFATRDHVVPKWKAKTWRERGGKVKEPTPPFVPACRWCNRSKDDMFIREWLKYLEHLPTKVGREDKRQKILKRKNLLLQLYGEFFLYDNGSLRKKSK